ncbi:MAG TPA: carbamoyl-phosphate synthase domain-containing protein [Rariglobus sp.]
MSTFKPAVLALEDGSVFRGRAFGADATIAGECVFNTSMTGYQEIITDPSYFGQIVTMTAPMIGNYGVNDEDTEASAPRASGLVVRELSPIVSNWRSQSSLDAYLRKYGIPGISEIDTRALTKKLRVDGAMKCCLSTLGLSDAEAVAKAKSWHDMAGSDYVKDTTCKEPYLWRADDAATTTPFTSPPAPPSDFPTPRPNVSASPPSISAPNTPSSASSSTTALTCRCSPPPPPPSR